MYFLASLSSLLFYYLFVHSFIHSFIPDEVAGDHGWSTECLNKPQQPNSSCQPGWKSQGGWWWNGVKDFAYTVCLSIAKQAELKPGDQDTV